jgi:hypothetical protein
MGLRGPLAGKAKHKQPPGEPVVTPQAVALFRRMRRLEMHCECLPDEELLKFDDWEERQCENCRECWILNGKLCECFGVPAWEFAYWNPRWTTHRPMQAAFSDFTNWKRQLRRPRSSDLSLNGRSEGRILYPVNIDAPGFCFVI